MPLVALDEKLLSKRDAERLNTTVQPAKSIYHKKKSVFAIIHKEYFTIRHFIKDAVLAAQWKKNI